MKIVKAKEMARIEKIAYAQGASEEAFMQAAGKGVAEAAKKMCRSREKKIILLCGFGNNGGDAYVAGIDLLLSGYDVVALAITPFEKSSPLCRLQGERFAAKGKIIWISGAEDIDFGGGDLLIDGIFGTGFHGEVEGLFATMIEKANRSGIPLLSIDIPSGINGNTGEVAKSTIIATETLFLGLPKKGCFIGEAWNHVGSPSICGFGLSPAIIDQAEEDFIILTDALIKEALPKIKRNRHKYEAGYVVGIGGSPGMPGAAILSSFASLKAGAGIVRLLHPKEMELEFGAAPLEIVRVPYDIRDTPFAVSKCNAASACFIGPGFGTTPEAENLLKGVLKDLTTPYVLDAEALTLLSTQDLKLPKNGILTPHQGEMKRLLHIKEKHIEDLLGFYDKCQKYVEEKEVTLVLKGSPTLIFHPWTSPFLSARGTPGMATAGSGDVLTGMIAAFLAAKASPLDAACLGVYMHGLAGEFAAKVLTNYCLVAGDILDYLPHAFHHLSTSGV